MSQRGSFVTSYIYCRECLEVAKGILLSDDKYLRGVQIPMWKGGGKDPLPVIAGKIGGMDRGDERRAMNRICGYMAARVCHEIRIALLGEDTPPVVFIVKPGKMLEGKWLDPPPDEV